jgi:GNAT superfamily N-acetyltransferase
MISIEKVDNNSMQHFIAPLAVTLMQCVEQGTSIGFVKPFGLAQSTAFWEAKFQQKRSGYRLELFVASIKGVIAGCVMLDLETSANQTHRVDIAKLLAHPHYQRKGIAIELMQALEKHALLIGRSLFSTGY